jgi:hypothetical protein
MDTKPAYTVYPVGTPGQPWGEEQRQQWRSLQHKKRDYFTNVVSPLLRLAAADVLQYGSLDYRGFGAAQYPLFAARSKEWDAARPMVLVTGGVHGYETSGVHGALLFVQEHMAAYSQRVNVLVLPCVSPWGYETVNRWNPLAIDPNRSFVPSAPGCAEAAAAMACIAEHVGRSAGILMHTDLHETTDTDNSEFVPGRIARDGLETPEWDPIPDGFYLLGSTDHPNADFQRVLIEAVSKVTHIAPTDERGYIFDAKAEQHGVINYEGRRLGLCGAFSDALYRTTTEVYPDSPRGVGADECNRAHVVVVVAGIEYALAHAAPPPAV